MNLKSNHHNISSLTEMRKLSIIIPHYNSAKSLLYLIEKIPKREDIEVIVIDDKSEMYDDYLTIKDAFSQSGVIFIDNDTELKGAGTCRNIGLSIATGKWVLFADADDYFVDEFYEIIEKFFDFDYDVIFFKPTSVDLSNNSISTRHKNYSRIIDNYLADPSKKNELKLRCSFDVPWSKMFNRDFLIKNNVHFDEVLAANDVMFSVNAGIKMNEFSVSPKVIYCVTKGHGTLTRRGDREIFDIRLAVFIRYCKFLKNKLSKADYWTIGLSGWTYIKRACQDNFGIASVIKTVMILVRNGIPITRFSFKRIIAKVVLSQKEKSSAH